jgi:hypothetical protein
MSELAKTHKAIFMGEVFKYEYEVDRWYRDFPKARKVKVVVSYKEIERNDNFNSPPLEEGAGIYLSAIDKKSSINNVVRSTDNSYIYYTNHELDDVTNEKELEESRLEVEDEIKELIKKREEQEQKDILEKVMRRYNKLPWYKKLFKKKPSPHSWRENDTI